MDETFKHGANYLVFILDSQRIRGSNRARQRNPNKFAIPRIIRFTLGEVGLKAGIWFKGQTFSTFTIFDITTTPPTLIRRDISLEDIRARGGKLPELYFDELGNMRGGKDELIMEGPRRS